MSEYIHSDLGNRGRGDVVEVTLSGSAANVRLLDSSNFSSYRRRARHSYVGGLAKQSPIRLGIPHQGHWHAVVDMQGLRGTTRAGIRVIPASALQPLPAIQERHRDIATIAENISGAHTDSGSEDRDFDVFISHAAEDKDSLVRPLALGLQDRGLSVWFDEFELRVGDSLRRKIDAG